MKKSLIGIIVLICVFTAVVMSSRGIAVDVSMEDRLAKLEKRITDAEGKLTALETKITSLESKPVAKANILPKLTTSPVKVDQVAGKNTAFKPTAGQIVYLNADETKYHFWEGCTWYGYGTESTLEEAEAKGAKPCMLCQMHKVIKQK